MTLMVTLLWQAWTTSSNAIVPLQHSNMYLHNTYPTNNMYAVHPPNPAPNYPNDIVPASNWVSIQVLLFHFSNFLFLFGLNYKNYS